MDEKAARILVSKNLVCYSKSYGTSELAIPDMPLNID